MPVDIGKLIKFNAHGSGENKLPKITINALLNLPIVVKKWHIENSRFSDGNPDGVFVEMEIETQNDGKQWRMNTGSGVIISQLEEIKSAAPTTAEFQCIIRRAGKAYKMFPAEDQEARK